MDQDQVPYVDALLEHAARHPARLTVPGHKGGMGADPAMIEALGPRALDMDLPALIEGIDVGPPESNPFEQAQRLAADAWGAARTWFLVGGASQGNHAALLAMRHSGRSIVMQRNVHSSAIDGSVLADLMPTFIAPEIDPELGVAHGATPAGLRTALDAAPDAIAALVVSPTYFGACGDIAALVEICHSRGLPLIVDEAWGAHLHFSDELPQAALDAGADLVISSTHKIVGSLTQSAMIHLGKDSLIDGLIIDRVVTLLESTSPSSLLALSLDAARRMAAVRGHGLLTETLATLRVTRRRIRKIPGLDVLDDSLIGNPGVAGWDPLRLTVDVRGTHVTGHHFADLIFDLGIDYELATETVVVFTFGMGGSAAELAEELLQALEQVVGTLGPSEHEPSVPFAVPPPWGPLEMSIRDAFLGHQEAVPFDSAEGRISCEALAAYPPGIPNVLPGERLTRETLDFIADTLAHGGKLRGASDRTLETVRVVIEDNPRHMPVSGQGPS
ncbi:MAG: amino acid decarboxylase [Actinomycetota bacterium]|nr:amino acid decarboxylase [Actinomycetota bacterium]